LRTEENHRAAVKIEQRNFYEIISRQCTLWLDDFRPIDLAAYENDLITEETAKLFASRKPRVTQASI